MNIERPSIKPSLSASTLPWVIFVFLFFSCKKETEVYQTEALSDYLPLVVNKYITYHIDSTLYTNFGRNTEIHSYQVKHEIDAMITDNLNRPSYRVYRYLRDSAGIQPWVSNGSYLITPTLNRIELVEDNLRFIKLHLPLKKDFTWKGNEYLPQDPYGTLYNFNNDDFMIDWDFIIESMNGSLVINGNTISGIMTISEADEISIPDTITVLNNKIMIPDKTGATWAIGNSTDTITIIPPSPSSVKNSFLVCNRTNRIARLNNILIPVGYNRSYRYRNGQWTYPLDGNNNTDSSVYAGSIYASKNVAVEKYAKNIGLISRELIMWEYQPSGSSDDGYRIGFGLKMWMIDHN